MTPNQSVQGDGDIVKHQHSAQESMQSKMTLRRDNHDTLSARLALATSFGRACGDPAPYIAELKDWREGFTRVRADFTPPPSLLLADASDAALKENGFDADRASCL